MRWIAACLAPIFVVLALPAAHIVSPGKPGPMALSPEEAKNYTIQLLEITHYIAENYVRKIPRAELLEAALRGLYERALKPAPSNLRSMLAQASSSERQLHLLVADLRLKLGNPEPLHGAKAIQASLRALTRLLDPYCVVLTGAEVQRTTPPMTTEGLGFELLEGLEVGPLIIKTVALGGPAQKAGLRPGDQILEVDGQPVGRLGTAALRLLQANRIKLCVQRPGAGLRTVLLRAEFFRPELVLGVNRLPNNSWNYLIDPGRGIGYVRLGMLDVGASEQAAEVLAQLQKANIRGLILDLRWCPGGYLNQAREVVDLFLGDCSLPYLVLPTPGNWLALADVYLNNHRREAVVYNRAGDLDYRALAPRQSSFFNFPLAVLINGETTGGGELVAAVLQDNLRARIVGQRTRGKGSVQKVWDFKGGDARLLLTIPIPDTGMKLTDGLLIRPSGKNLNRFADSKPTDDWGVRPDPGLEFPVSAALGRQLYEWSQWQSLRPGASSESLPLDDPAADPQRQAALQILLDGLDN